MHYNTEIKTKLKYRANNISYLLVNDAEDNLTNAVVRGSLRQKLRVMYSLSTGQYLFSSHEHVVRVGIFLQHTTRHTVH